MRNYFTPAILCMLFCQVVSLAVGRDQNKSLQHETSLLYSTNSDLRDTAAKRLIAIGQPAVPSLVHVICENRKSHFDVAWPMAAEALGKLKAEGAAPCLAELLMYGYPAIGPVEMKSDETLAHVDPAFAALVEIGEPSVPAIRQRLPFLGPGPAIMAVRALRVINTPSARAAAEAYINVLQHQIQLTNQILRDFGPTLK